MVQLNRAVLSRTALAVLLNSCGAAADVEVRVRSGRPCLLSLLGLLFPAVASQFFMASLQGQQSAPVINPGGVVNAADRKAGIAPGSIVEIYGTNLSSGTCAAERLPWPTELGCSPTHATVNGRTAPLLYISPMQINARVPFESGPGSASVIVTRGGAASNAVNLSLVLESICQVPTDKGWLKGALEGNTCAFKGVPFTAPPVGDLRWRPPAEHAAWDGVLNATEFGNQCPAINAANQYVGDEDCLVLNVWMSATTTDASLPAIVWVHGGSNRQGQSQANGLPGSGTPTEGRQFVEQAGVIFVSVQYRLGPLGFWAHTVLDAESPRHVSGNYGILDQIAALRWVQKNIAFFGGDPRRITLAGFSAGATDVAAIMTSPLAGGLFTSAAMSGARLLTYATLADFEADTGSYVVNTMSCGTASDIAACMRSKSARDLIILAPGVNNPRHQQYDANVDFYLLTGQLNDVITEGKHNHVPFIIGHNKDDAAVQNVPIGSVPDEATYRSRVNGLFGPAAGAQALSQYPSSNYQSPEKAYIALLTDWLVVCPAHRMAQTAASKQLEPIYHYSFEHPLAGSPAAEFGVYHGVELMFLFKDWRSSQTGPYNPTPGEVELSNQMFDYWTRSAKGNPNGPSSVTWLPYSLGPEQYLKLDTPTIGVGSGFLEHKCSFWDGLPRP